MSGLRHRPAHRGEDLVIARPRPAGELCEQSALSRDDGMAVHQDVELSLPAGFEIHRLPEPVFNQSGETRRFGCRCASRVAVHDSNGHWNEYTWRQTLRISA